MHNFSDFSPNRHRNTEKQQQKYHEKIPGEVPNHIIAACAIWQPKLYLRRALHEGPMLETLDHTIRIGSTPTFLYFDLSLFGIADVDFTYID